MIPHFYDPSNLAQIPDDARERYLLALEQMNLPTLAVIRQEFEQGNVGVHDVRQLFKVLQILQRKPGDPIPELPLTLLAWEWQERWTQLQAVIQALRRPRVTFVGLLIRIARDYAKLVWFIGLFLAWVVLLFGSLLIDQVAQELVLDVGSVLVIMYCSNKIGPVAGRGGERWVVEGGKRLRRALGLFLLLYIFLLFVKAYK